MPRNLDVKLIIACFIILPSNIAIPAQPTLDTCYKNLKITSVSAIDSAGRQGIKIVRQGDDPDDFPTIYVRTERGIMDTENPENLHKYYPGRLLDVTALKGLAVLDAATGDGLIVRELNSMGINIKGLDIYLNDRQKEQPELFVESDMTATGFPESTFDLIFCTHGVFAKEPNRRDLISKTLLEVKRILKVGGVLRISPQANLASIREIVNQVGGLEITAEQPLNHLKNHYAVEIKRKE